LEKSNKFLPFNLYDFYGYIIPGVLLLAGSFLIMAHFIKDIESVYIFATNYLNSLKFTPAIIFFIILISIIYFVGHINAMISHLIFDRILVKRILGYPIYDLLNIDNNLRDFSRATNYYLLTLINLLIFVPILKLWFPSIIKLDILIRVLIFLFVLLFTLRTIILFLEKYFFEEVKVAHINDALNFEKSLKIVHWLYCSFYYLIEKTIIRVAKEFISNDTPLDQTIIDKFANKIKTDFSLDYKAIGTDNYWLPVIKIANNNEIILKYIMNWLNLYSFLKNLSMVGFLLCLESGIFITLNSYNHNFNSEPIWESIIFGLLYIGSLLLLLRYWVIYRNYYTKYIIRAYTVL